jgi:hypothetical protein
MPDGQDVYKSPEAAEEERLKAAEYASMKAFMERKKQGKNWDPKNFHFRLAMTPAEHGYIGSSGPGGAFHPHYPVALAGEIPLEAVNKARENIENELGRLSVLGPDRKYVFVKLHFKPLDDSGIKNNDFLETFEVISVQDGEGKEISIPPKFVDDFFKKAFEETQTRTREMLRKGQTLV